MSIVAVIGGGAAGMAAALAAADSGHEVHLFEKNEKLGKKIYITGKGRCNLTNDCPPEDFFLHVCQNPRFLYSAFSSLNNQDVMRFFEEHGLKLKTERGGRVFPVTDHASDVIRTLQKELERRGVRIHLTTPVEAIVTAREEALESGSGREGKKVTGVCLREQGTIFPADAVVVATGGLSYPSTGSTGDGYRMAGQLGHTVTELAPSLVPLESDDRDAARLQGLSLKNVTVRVEDHGKLLYEGFGEMMFTHFGVTGPLILSASTKLQKALRKAPLTLAIDLKSALSDEVLERRFIREFEGSNKAVRNILTGLYPSSLVPVMLERSGIPGNLPGNAVTRQMRGRLLETTRRLTFSVTGTRGFKEAVITRGGVCVKEVRPATMESKLVRGLYFAGEVLDVDAQTGGYNLQIAWSSGAAAGRGIPCEREEENNGL